MKHEKTANRLRSALYAADIRPLELAERSKVSKSSISQYMNGTHKPSNISAGKMGAVLGVNPLWLMGFDVSPEPEEEIGTITTEEKKLIRAFRTADVTTQKIVLKILGLEG